MGKSAADFQVSEIQSQVWQAAQAAMGALESFDAPIRTLAIRQLAVDAEIRAVAAAGMNAQTAAAVRRPVQAAPGALLTVDQVAEECHVTPDCVRRWLGRRDGLKKTKNGGRTLIHPADLQDFRKRSTEKTQRAANTVAA